jgi:CHAT domain-containing protein
VTVGADELLGLVSALISLGSAGVVASVVPVNDPATVPLMTALHEQLRAGADLAGALTRARRSVSGDPVAQATAYSFIALGT